MKKPMRKWTAAWMTIAFTWLAMGIISPRQLKAVTAKAENAASTIEAAKEGNSETSSFEKEETIPEIVKKKKFPWLWVAAGVVVAGVIVYFTLIKKPKYDLTVELGAGVTGTPAAGKYTYKKGKQIAYNFSSIDGFKNLIVLFDGLNAASSGTIVMDKAHSLKATAAQMANYSLIVKTNAGVSGSPAAGIFQYREGTAIPYNYAVAEGFKDLTVLLDGKTTAASGTIIMDQSHSLEATAIKNDEYILVVDTDAGVFGTPIAGTYIYIKGTAVSYQYTVTNGVPFARLDGSPVLPSGMLKMKANHVLKISLGTQPDIRGKWHLLLKGEYGNYHSPLNLSFSGGQTIGTYEVLEDPTDIGWEDFWGVTGTYEISSTLVTFLGIGDGTTNYNFHGTFTSENSISGTFYCHGDVPFYNDHGTWTATRIK